MTLHSTLTQSLDQRAECEDADAIYAIEPADFLHSRLGQQRAADGITSALLPVQGQGHAGRFGACGTDDVYRLADGRAGRDDVVNDQHAPAQCPADDAAAFTMCLGFFAIERERHITTVTLIERCRGDSGQRNAFVGRSEDHVEAEA